MPKPSYGQTELLIEFMEAHKDLARGRISNKADGRKKSEMLWHQLMVQLNSAGGCIKDASAWKKHWNDKKLNIRKGLAKRRKAMTKTGGGFDKIPDPSAHDARIISILGEDSDIGIPGVMVEPFSPEHEVEVHHTDVDVEDNIKLQENVIIEEIEFTQPSATQLDNEFEDIITSEPISTKDSIDESNADISRPRKRTKSVSSNRGRSRLPIISNAREKLVEMEERRISSEARMASAVSNIGDYLISNKEAMNAQILAAEAVVSAMEGVKAATSLHVQLAEAQLNTARLQAEAARAQAEVAKAQLRAAEGSCFCKK